MSDVRVNIELIFGAHPFARFLLESLHSEGHEAYIVGGIVRDSVRAALHEQIDFEPIEVDIATSALPSEIKQIFRDFKTIEVGEAFGVLVIRSSDGVDYEVATYRSESDYDGRRPGSVHHVSNLKEDVLRRDFTVNGLALDIDGHVIDYVDGIVDLKNHVIRTIGEADLRFQEDYLRMLRAVRFSALLSAKISEDAVEAAKRHAQQLSKISAERIRDEFLRMLEDSRSARAIELLDELGLLDVVLPELVDCKGVPQPVEFHPEGDVFTHTLLALKVADKFIVDPRVKLALLLHDVGKPHALEKNEGDNAAGHDAIGADMAMEICARLRLSRGDSKFIMSLVAEHQRIGHFPSMNRAKQVRFIKKYENELHSINHFSERYYWLKALVQLMIADCQASTMKSRGWLSVLRAIRPLLLHIEDLEKRVEAHNLLNGNDIIALGVPKGPEIGRILEAVYEMIYAGEVTSYSDALAQAKLLIEKRSNR